MVFVYHVGSQSSLYTAQQPLNNIVRGTIAAIVEALGGSNISSVARYTEALSLNTPESVRVALRTQQIVAYETGIADTIDPLAGSYYVESLTDELEDRAAKILEKIEAMGGAIPAIEQGYIEKEIARSGYEDLKRVRSGERVHVGVNMFQVDEPPLSNLLKIDPAEEGRQIEKVKNLRASRDNTQLNITLDVLKQAARQGENLVTPVLSAVKAYATVGEISNALREIYGEYKRPRY
jgi:methylmalonyl-CoA mutase N-terminal domain/subunit